MSRELQRRLRDSHRLPTGAYSRPQSQDVHSDGVGPNMIERLNEEIRRRTPVVGIFPNRDRCLRLIRALAVETHEDWLEDNRYLNRYAAGWPSGW